MDLKPLFLSCSKRHDFDFNSGENRLVFKRYDYAAINSRINKDAEVDTGELSLESAEYTSNKGISKVLKNACIEQLGFSEEWANQCIFEALQAMDEALTSLPEALGETKEKGVDKLDAYLKSQEVTRFSLRNGKITFYAGDTNVLTLPIISGRQEVLRAAYFERSLQEREALSREIIEEQHRAEISRQHRERESLYADAARAALGPSDDSSIVSIKLPRRDQQHFSVPRDHWIHQEETPFVLEARYRQDYLCMAHAGELLRREVGGRDNLADLGYVEGHDAWMFRRDLVAAEGGTILADFNEHLKIAKWNRGRSMGIREVNTKGKKYEAKINGLWDTLDTAHAGGKPVMLSLYYRGSAAKEKTARFNSRLAPEHQSLNTHITYYVGSDYRTLTSSPRNGEKASSYLARALHLNWAGRGYLANAGGIRVDGQECEFKDGKIVDSTEGNEMKLTAESVVEYKDHWFSHQFAGSKVTSLTEFMGSGKYVPTNIMALNTEKLEPKTLPQSPQDPRLAPVDTLYLQTGDTIRGVFESEVSDDPTVWENYRWYLRIIAFDTLHVKKQIDPIPVPDLEQLQSYIDELGGWQGLRHDELRAQCNEFNRQNPGEHALFIESGSSPWSTVAPLFDRFDTTPTNRERRYLLSEIDRINGSIDIRLFERMKIDENGHTKTVKDYMKWEVGQFIWMSDEVIETLVGNIVWQRQMAEVHLPSGLNAATPEGLIRVEVSEEERRVIETVTDDPEIKLLLMLVLLNEQKSTKGFSRGMLARTAELSTFGLWKEKSIGMFQVEVREADMMLFIEKAKNGDPGYEEYDFKSLGEYRDALLADDVLNARVAVMRLEEASGFYRYQLHLNGEEGNIEDSHFVSAVLTMYNRPQGNVYAGQFALQAERVSDAFDFGLLYDTYSTDGLTEDYGGPDDPLDGVTGADQVVIAKFWGKLVEKLVDKGIIQFSAEELEQDLLITQQISESRNFEIVETNPYQRIVQLIRLGKVDFLQTHLYRKVKTAYEQQMALKGREEGAEEQTPQTLSFLISDEEYETSAVQNYGYRAIRYGQLDEILDYSYGLNKMRADEAGYEYVDLEGLNSVRLHRGQDLMVTVGDEQVAVRTSFAEGEPFKLELTEEELKKYPTVNSNGLVSILFTGGRGGKAHGGGLPDSIKQILINPRTGDLTIVDLPRDIRMDYTSRNGSSANGRLNAVRLRGGKEEFKEAVAGITGQEVVHSLNVDFEAMMENIDDVISVIGNIEIENPDGEAYISRVEGKYDYFPPKTVITSGHEALVYARFRKGWAVNSSYDTSIEDPNTGQHRPNETEIKRVLDGSDTYRTARQSLLMNALMEKALQPKYWPKLLTKVPGLLGNFEHDLPLTEIPEYTGLAQTIHGKRNMDMVSVAGKIKPIYTRTGRGRRYQGEELTDENVYISAINDSLSAGTLEHTRTASSEGIPDVEEAPEDLL